MAKMEYYGHLVLWMDREVQTVMKKSLMKGHIARASRHDSLIILGEPSLDLDMEKA